MSNYPRISDMDYQKAVGQFRLALIDVFHPFHELGHQILIPGAIEEVVFYPYGLTHFQETIALPQLKMT